jgi:hypothetical protein
MKTINIKSVGVEFPLNITSVSLEIVESTGRISRVTDSITVSIEGIYQNMTSELFDKVLQELKASGIEIIPTDVAE